MLNWNSKNKYTRALLLHQTFSAVGVAALLLSSVAFAQRDAARAKFETLPDGVAVYANHARMELHVLEDGTAAVHIVPDGASSPRTLVLGPQQNLRKTSVIHRSGVKGSIALSTPKLTASIEKNAPYALTFFDAMGNVLLREADPFLTAHGGAVQFAHRSEEALYGVHGLDMEEANGSILRNDGGKVAAGVQGNSGAPLIFSAHWGLLIDSDGGQFSNTGGNLDFQHSSRPDVEFFVLAGAPLETMAAMSRLVGPPPIAPRWTLGFINSQWGSTQDEIQKIVATYRERKLPLDGFILDFDWKAWGEDNYGEWRWNSTNGAGAVGGNKYPDGASGHFGQWMREQGVHLAGILKPRILTTTEAGQPTEAAAYATAHHLWYPDEPTMPDYFSHRPALDLDFNNAETRNWYWQHLAPAFHTGMDAWWNDEADYSGKTYFNNFQFLNMGRMLFEGQRSESDQRVWSINRNFYLGSNRYGYAGWSGDVETGFASMALQRRRMVAALNTGEFHWSMDTGGFHGHPSNENYARWMQFAALVPIMRVHGDFAEKRQPWVYGAVAEAAARKALELRSMLLPTFYSYERQNAEGEVGLVRPLFWAFAEDKNAAALTSEWMLGDGLLVSPVVDEGATSQQVYLPKGEWFNYATGEKLAGEKNTMLSIDAKSLQDIPLFVRAGSIFATQKPQMEPGQKPTDAITLEVFPAARKASFTVYDDDGSTYGYEKGSYLRQVVTAEQVLKTTHVVLSTSTGSYHSVMQAYLLRIHTSAERIKLNGNVVALAVKSSAGDDLREGQVLKTEDRFGSVIEIKIPAGKAAVLDLESK